MLVSTLHAPPRGRSAATASSTSASSATWGPIPPARAARRTARSFPPAPSAAPPPATATSPRSAPGSCRSVRRTSSRRRRCAVRPPARATCRRSAAAVDRRARTTSCRTPTSPAGPPSLRATSRSCAPASRSPVPPTAGSRTATGTGRATRSTTVRWWPIRPSSTATATGGRRVRPCTNPRSNTLQSPALAPFEAQTPPTDDQLSLKTSCRSDMPTVNPLKGPGGWCSADRSGWCSTRSSRPVDSIRPPRRLDSAGRDGATRTPVTTPRQAGIRQHHAPPARILHEPVPASWSRDGSRSAPRRTDGLDLTVVIDAPSPPPGSAQEAQFVTQGASSECRLLNSGHRLERRKK